MLITAIFSQLVYGIYFFKFHTLVDFERQHDIRGFDLISVQEALNLSLPQNEADMPLFYFLLLSYTPLIIAMTWFIWKIYRSFLPVFQYPRRYKIIVILAGITIDSFFNYWFIFHGLYYYQYMSKRLLFIEPCVLELLILLGYLHQKKIEAE